MKTLFPGLAKARLHHRGAGALFLKREAMRRRGISPVPTMLSSRWSVFAAIVIAVGGTTLANAGLSPDGRTDWNGTVNTDFNTAGNWTPNGANPGSAPPVAGDVAWFSSTPSNKLPKLNSSLSIAGLYFNGTASAGYTISSLNTSTAFTLTGYATSIGTEIGDNSAVAIGAENTSASNTISAPLTLAPASGTTSTIYQAGGGTLQMSGAIGGTANLDKTGAGTLTLSGTNTFTGNLVIDGGTLAITNSQNLGDANNQVFLNDGGTFNNQAIITNFARVFNLTAAANATVTLKVDGSLAFPASGTRGITGGSSTLTIVKTGGSSITLTGNPTTYLGNWRIDGGQLSTGNDAGLGDANNDVTLNGGAFNFSATSGSYSPPSTRTFTLNNTPGNQIQTGVGVTLTFSNANQLTGSGGFTESTTGTLNITADQNFTGPIGVSFGTLSISSIKDVNGGASAAGAPTTTANGTISLGGTISSATLKYTGSSASTTNRVIDLSGTTRPVALDQSGTGNLKFTSDFTATGAGSKTLTLQGSTSGTGEISGAIVNNSATNLTSVTKAGTGTWTLSGANTYTGATQVSGGKLFINGDQSTATGSVTVSGSGTTLGGTGTIGGGVTVNSGALLEGGTGSTGATEKLTVNGTLMMNSGSLIQLAIGPSGAHSTLARTGSGAWTFAPSQAFSFLDVGATTGTYQDIITGVADPGAGISNWTIMNPGWSGTFNWDGLNIDFSLTAGVAAVPEPGTWMAAALTLAAIGCGGVRRKKLKTDKLRR